MSEKIYPRSAPGHARRFQDEAKAQAESTPIEAQRPVSALDAMERGPVSNAEDIPPEFRSAFERTEWERKTASVVMQRVGAIESDDPKVGHAVIPALADSAETWEMAASITDEEYTQQRLKDELRQMVMADVHKLRDLRRKGAREKLLAALKT